MRFSNFIFGVALLLIAITLALTITFRNDPRGQGVASTERSASPRGEISSPPTGPAGLPNSPRSSNPRPPHAPLPDPAEMDLALEESPAAPPLTPDERQALSARTAGVKRAALARLDLMTERFDLTRDQRRKIFPLLVESTSGFHPAMVVTEPSAGGYVALDPGTFTQDQTADDAIHDLLDPTQQDDFVDAKLNEIKWWEEIVSQLDEDFDSAVAAGIAPPVDPATPPPPVDPATPPADPAPQQGDNIFDLLNQ